MPRLAKSKQHSRDDNFRAVISFNLEKVHLTWTEMGKRCGLSPKQMTVRRKEPDRFSKVELRKICNVLNISPETLINRETL
jgi:DNA-binding Xre family transcriptional regulator